MKVSRRNIFGLVSVVFFCLGVGSYFLPAKTYFYLDSAQDIERCDESLDKNQVRTERYLLMSDYISMANNITGAENYGPCPYQDYKVKTYGLELFALSAVFTAGSALHMRKENK